MWKNLLTDCKMGKLLTALGILLILQIASSTKLVCHMTNWAQYRPGAAKFTPDNIDPFLCTHIVYAQASINSLNQISTVERNDEQQYGRLNGLKRVNPVLKTLLSVGGTVNGLNPFTAVVAKAEGRATFIKSAISFLRTHNFDGLNLAWNHPGHNGSPEDDKQSFTLLVTELFEAFRDEARENRRTPLLLSASVGSLIPTIDKAYEVDKIVSALDFINVMNFDFHGSWEAATGHHSPLYASSEDSGTSIHHNINSSLSHWLSLGAPAEKLLLGFSTYGRTFRLSGGANGLGAPANGPTEAGAFTRTEGFWSYYEICNYINSATVGWISEQEVPYATYASSWVGYDDKRSFSSKVQWLTAHSLGGAHVWTLDMDDFGGSFCSDGAFPLVNHLRTSLGFGPKPTTAPAAPRVREAASTFCVGRPNGLYVNTADRNTFFQCSNGYTYLFHCQLGLVYSDICKCCDWP
ncbi:chitinase, acidic.1 isoform X2 [Mugil cephalus]|uniref:chitinase, acidic.1 isoform X2 n=1 Tax=Mugil cephalus TaxID=48193 RepID=UPI001FB6A821|nr:chitinase, acidic.1 isoform X2 [Mugil cephalus]